jgi:hydrogenase/urease accessory protein HupE
MKTYVHRAGLVLPGLLASAAALAHPGHTTAPAMGFWQGLVHVLSEPDHLGMLMAALVIGVIAVRTARARAHRGNRTERVERR